MDFERAIRQVVPLDMICELDPTEASEANQEALLNPSQEPVVQPFNWDDNLDVKPEAVMTIRVEESATTSTNNKVTDHLVNQRLMVKTDHHRPGTRSKKHPSLTPMSEKGPNNQHKTIRKFCTVFWQIFLENAKFVSLLIMKLVTLYSNITKKSGNTF